MTRKATVAPPADAGTQHIELQQRIAAEPVSAALLYKLAMNLGGGGLRGLLQEILRNAFLHGRAETVHVEVGVDAKGRPTLTCLDDGVGMDEIARLCWLSGIGYSQADGTGSGRLAALTLCQIIEVVTVPQGEPEFAYRTVVNLPAFVIGTARHTWAPVWERVPRERTVFPKNVVHGAMFTYRDFRVSDPQAPADETRMRDVSRTIRGDDIRSLVPIVLPPDLARRTLVGGTRIAVPDIDGFPLWRMSPRVYGTLGTVSGELRLAETTDGSWCTIGGTTASVPVQNFLMKFRENAPAIAAHIPAEFGERRLVGFIRIEALERYPTQSREHFDPAFYVNAHGAETAEFLATVVGPVIRAKRAEYESRPVSEATRASLARIVARLHTAQGVTPGTVADGGDAPGGDPTAAVLQVNRVTYRLEAAAGDELADEAVFRIMNPLPGETFTWDDGRKRLIIERGEGGVSARVRAVAKPGIYVIDVRSDQYEHRQKKVNVDIRMPETPNAGPSDFRLIPMWTTVVAGEEKRIAVRSQGPTSGTYNWTIVRIDGSREHSVTGFTVSEDTRQVSFCPTEHGDYLVRCVDARNSVYVATTRVEVFARPTDHPAKPVDGGGGPGYGGNGTRGTVVGRDTLKLVFRNTHFELRSVPYLRQPWGLESEHALILFSDSHPANSGARTPEERDRHLTWCLAAAIAAFEIRSGRITAEDADGISRLQDDVLRSVFVSVANAAGAASAKAAAPKAGGSSQTARS